ncbi:MAG: PIN domain-containing protein [Gaiellaceae bacterium]
MILLDAYALIALLGDEPAADEVEQFLRRGDCWASAVNLAEAIDVSSRVHDLEPGVVRDALGALILSNQVRVIVADEESAWRAAELRQRYYAKETCELSLADCFLLGAAGPNDQIATADAPAAQVARAQGIGVVPLPDSSGHRP